MKKLSVIMTGGTIGGLHDAISGVVRPVTQLNYILDGLKTRGLNYDAFAEVRLSVPLNIMSENLVPSDWQLLARTVEQELHAGVDGVVITHGTDALPFSSSALAFMLRGIPVPVVITGATIPPNDPQTDAWPNLFSSMLFACRSSPPGVFVAFQGKDGCTEVYNGTHVRQIRPYEKHFDTIGNRVVASVHRDRVFLKTRRRSLKGKARRQSFKAQPALAKVSYFRIHPSFDPSILLAQLRLEPKAVLLELYHSGTACTRPDSIYDLVPAISALCQHGIGVFFTHLPGLTRGKPVLYDSSTKFVDLGAVAMPPMTTECMLTKLMWVYGQTDEPKRITSLLRRSLVGEIVRGEI